MRIGEEPNVIRKFAFVAALATATAFAGSALAFDLIDLFDEKRDSHGRWSEAPPRHRNGASYWAGERFREATSAQHSHYHWPDARYYGRHGMMFD